jgi:hypothetical protein
MTNDTQYQTDYYRARRAARKAAGICLDCDAPSAPDRLRCDAHGKAHSARNLALARRRRAAGLCLNCNEPALPNLLRCAPHNEYHSVRARATERRRRDAGLCIRCEAPSEKWRCPECFALSERKRSPQGMPLSRVKSPHDIRRLVDEMPYVQRIEVEKIVDRHIAACRNLGIAPESLDRVWVEAIEMVQEGEGELDSPWPDYRATWKYDVYVSPKGEQV